jgi:hypothetical protein
MDGLINLSDLKGFPIATSPAHFHGFPRLQQQISVTNNENNDNNNSNNDGHGGNGGTTGWWNETSDERYGSYFDVEPYTGRTMRAAIRLQVVANISGVVFDHSAPSVHKVRMMTLPHHYYIYSYNNTVLLLLCTVECGRDVCGSVEY